jgi:hypothetical protein
VLVSAKQGQFAVERYTGLFANLPKDGVLQPFARIDTACGNLRTGLRMVSMVEDE